MPLVYEFAIPVNRFLVPETVNGLCTAFFYVYNDEEPDSAGYPVLYSDNNNSPLNRKSTGESLIDLQVKSGKPAGWRNGTMQSNGSIASGSYIWFGLSTNVFWYPRFDYGARSYGSYWWEYGMDEETVIPDKYPLYNANYYEDFKFSMYFTYTLAQNYVRTLTQGITLIDTRKQIGTYKRSTIQTVRGTTALSRFATFPRQCLEAVYNASVLKALPTLIRSVLEYIRAITDMSKGRGLSRNCSETIKAGSETKRSQGFYRRTQEGVRGTDTQFFPVLFLRSLPETV
jgi:hypothetical protein